MPQGAALSDVAKTDDDDNIKIYEFLQSDVAKTNDDDSWLRRNDNFIPMSQVTQPTNSYVCNMSIT
jgi:hypothetical protein